MPKKLTWSFGLVILLIFQIIVALVIVGFLTVDFPSLAQQLGLKYQPELGILQFLVIYGFVISASICLWSLIWIKNSNIAGIQAGITVGILLFALGVAFFVKFNRVDVLLFDSIRGALMVIFGFLAYRDYFARGSSCFSNNSN